MNVAIEALQVQNTRLRCEIAEKDETIRQLRDLLKDNSQLPDWLPKLTPLEEQTLRMLMRRSLLTQDAFRTLRPDADTDGNNMRVHVFRIRRKLKPFGVRIESLWGRGYALDAASREMLQPPIAA